MRILNFLICFTFVLTLSSKSIHGGCYWDREYQCDVVFPSTCQDNYIPNMPDPGEDSCFDVSQGPGGAKCGQKRDMNSSTFYYATDNAPNGLTAKGFLGNHHNCGTYYWCECEWDSTFEIMRCRVQDTAPHVASLQLIQSYTGWPCPYY